MKTRIVFSLLLLVIAGLSCRKTAEKNHPDMVGYWRTNNTTLEIKSNGDAYWGRLTNSEEESIHGKATVKKDKLIISKKGLTKEVNINQYPHPERASFTEFNTVMVLNDEKFFKTPAVSIDKTWRCSNGVQDGDETAIDCGGDCEPCQTCSDQVKNQNETGVDCGGLCQPCEEAVCNSMLTANTVNMMACPGNTATGLQQNFTNPDFMVSDTLNRYLILNSYGQWDISIVLPKKPPGSLKYNLITDFFNVDETSDYNNASIQLKRNSGAGLTSAFPVGGQLYVTVNNGVISCTFCDIQFSSQQYGCMRASGKFQR